MSAGGRTPAIYAGLLGAAAGAVPTTAYGLPREELASGTVAPYVYFTLGCVAGAALSTSVHMIMASLAKVREARMGEKDVEPIRQVMAMSSEPLQKPAPLSSPQPVAASRPGGRHMAVRDWEASGVIRVQEPAPEPAVVEQKAAAPAVGAHAATDYSDIAEKYVSKKTQRERKTRRAGGVASALAERLGVNPFEGLPVIERADGTVGDVGTSWWNDALSSSIRTIEDIPDENFEPVTGSLESSVPSAASHFEQDTEASRRSAYISRNVAEVNVGIYPEHRTAAELDRDDIWERALQAMDERLPQVNPNPVFADAIGTIETIDEPDGLEGSTGFIPFKLHAGHPEVVDANSYVDYLIGDEFSRNPSKAARKSSRDFLTVIQGGSQKMRQLPTKGEQSTYRPRHFAPEHAPLAKEA
ncbi:MAG: hypothetical protein IJ092_09340 [Atopobiaceae bacterium]|nr:hypothetical protein [Atopobiaceae bacterium]